jgi:hypothetical protein
MMFPSWRETRRLVTQIRQSRASRVSTANRSKLEKAKLIAESDERRWEVKTPIKMDSFGDACGQQRKSSLPFIGHKTRASSMATDFEDMEPRRHIPKGLNQYSWLLLSADSRLTTYRSPDSAEIDGTLNFGPLGLQDDLVELPVVLEAKHLPFETIRSEARRIESSPMSQWECLSARRAPGELHVAAKPVTKVAIAHSSTLELTRFQRFIRRMESAGPRIVLDRLKEEWDEPPDTTIDEEVCFTEKLRCTSKLIRVSSPLRSNYGFSQDSRCRASARLALSRNRLVIRVGSWNCTAISVSRCCV